MLGFLDGGRDARGPGINPLARATFPTVAASTG